MVKTYIKTFKGAFAEHDANNWSKQYNAEIVSASWAVHTKQYQKSTSDIFITPIVEEEVLTVVFKEII